MSDPQVTAPVLLRHESGALYEVPADRAEAAIASGRFRQETPEEADLRSRRTEAPIQTQYVEPTVAGARGVLRGASLGATDLAEEATGTREMFEQLAAENPTATSAGEVGGALLTAIPSGGESLAARAALAPGRAVIGAGERLGAAAARTLAPEGAALGTRLAARTLGGAIEGGTQMGLTEGAHILTEEALGEDPGDVSDRLIGSVGLGALIGSAAHGGGGVLSEAGQAGARGARHTADLFRRQFLAQTGEELSPGLAGLAEAALRRGVPLAQVASGDAEGLVPRLFGPGGAEARRVLVEGPARIERHIAALSEAQSDAARARAVLERELHGPNKVRALADVIDGSNGSAQMATSEGLVADARRLADVIDADAQRYQGGSGNYGPRAGRIATTLRGAVERAEDEIAQAATAFEAGTITAEQRSAQTFAAMDQLRRVSGGIAAHTGVEPVESLFGRLRAHLENDAVWGAEATALQRETNEALHREIGWGSQFDRMMMREEPGHGFERVMMADSARVASHLNGAGSAANATNERIAREAMQATSDLADAVIRNRGGTFSAEGIRAAEQLRGASSRLRELYAQATNDATLLRQAARLESHGGLGALGTGGIAAAAGGPLLGAAAALGSAVANPVRSARVLGTIERMLRQTDTGITASVRAFLGRSTTAAERAAARALRAGEVGARLSYRGVQAYEARVRELSLHRDATRLSQDIARSTADLTHPAPRLTAALQTTAARATAYLQQQQPRGRVLPGTLVPSQNALPSRAEMDRFLRIARAVDDPASLMDDLRHRTLTPEAVQAVRQVYPQLYALIVRTVAQELSRPGAHPSYQDRLQLGTLLGIPTDPSMTPGILTALQQSHEATQAQAAQEQSARQAPDLSGMMATGMDRVEARRATA